MKITEEIMKDLVDKYNAGSSQRELVSYLKHTYGIDVGRSAISRRLHRSPDCNLRNGSEVNYLYRYGTLGKASEMSLKSEAVKLERKIAKMDDSIKRHERLIKEISRLKKGTERELRIKYEKIATIRTKNIFI